MAMNVFVYGTLQIREIMRAVTGRCFEMKRAVLPGYARFTVRGQSYPGIVAARDSQVEGMVCLDVEPGSLELLDLFEGDLYERLALRVNTADGQKLSAQVYVVPDDRRDFLSSEPWDPALFKKKYLADFLASIQDGASR